MMLRKFAIASLLGIAVLSAANAGGRLGRGNAEKPIIPSTDFTISDYTGSSDNNGPYTYIQPNTHIVGSCAGTVGATCTVDVSQLLVNGNWGLAPSSSDRVIQTDAGGFFQGRIDNGSHVAAGTVLHLSTAVTGTALANGQRLYTGPLPGTQIVSGSGNTWTVNISQRVGAATGTLPIMMTNGLGKCFNGYIDDGAGGIGTTLHVQGSGDCVPLHRTAVALAIGQTISGGDNNITWGGGLENQGAFRFICATSHINYDDPILAPGVRGGSSHLHNFFGNTLTDYLSTYQSLRTTGGGSCAGGPLNRTGYWHPALIDPNGNGGAGAVVTPDYIELYYKSDRTQTGNVVPGYVTGSNHFVLPMQQLNRGLRYISGYDVKTNTLHESYFWECPDDLVETAAPGYSAPSDLPTLWGYLQAVGKTTTACKRIAARLEAAACWDGKLDNADHFSHVTSQSQDGFGHAVCPTDHPILIPFLTFIVTFNRNTEDFSQWFLSSDCPKSANLATCKADGNLAHTSGSTFHVDWFGAWDYSIMDVWQTHCLQMGSRVNDPTYTAKPSDTQNSSAGVICDGRTLSTAGGTTPSGYVSPPISTAVSTWPNKYLPIPARPQ